MKFVPVVLSALLLAAHFFRSGNFGLVALVLVTPLLLTTGARWSVRAVQLFLLLAAAEWVRTAMDIARERAAMGASSTRMFVILGAVALFSAASALALRPLQRAECNS